MTRRLIVMALAGAAWLFAGEPATAGLLPVRVSITPEAGNYRFTYAVVLPTDSELRAGDYFTIYDFAGYVPNSNTQPEGWAFSADALGTTPGRLNPTDNPAELNLTWEYTGPTIAVGQGLGNFWAASVYQDTTDSHFAARTHRSSDGLIDSNITETFVPVPAAPEPAVPGVPEPTTLALAALGLPLVALARRRFPSCG